ncbi:MULTISPECIES: flagellar motor switch protein FliM [unclassified Nocardioides]|uniref:flagellar motor switch protein FliM n=1 Tax=unclassified Nocardioides TaxID=2615069 RepID=UPI003616C79F
MAPSDTSVAPPPAPAATGATRRPASEPVLYDFRRPIQLSREHSRMLQLAIDGFCRQATTVFTSSLRTVCSVTLVGIEQSAYSEYVDSLDATTYLTLFSAEPLLSKCVLELPVPAVMTAVDFMLGGPGRQDQPERPLSEIESSVAGGLIERLLAELRYSVAGIVNLEPVVTGVEYSPQFAQVAGSADVMVAIRLELKINERTFRMSMCMPFSGLLPHMVRAAAPAPVSDRERAQRARSAAELKDQFQQVPVDVAVRLRPTTLSPGDLAALQPGDAIRLNHPASAPLEVVVDGINFAHATAGTSGFRLAALIVGTPKENQ